MKKVTSSAYSITEEEAPEMPLPPQFPTQKKRWYHLWKRNETPVPGSRISSPTKSPLQHPAPKAQAIEEDDDTIQPRRAWYYFWKKTPRPYLYAKIILPNNRIITKPVWITGGASFRFQKMAYCINKEAIKTEKIQGKLRPVSYYFMQHPDPIQFRYKETYEQETSKTFKMLLDAKVVQDAVSNTGSMILMIILIAACIAAASGVYTAWRVYHLGG